MASSLIVRKCELKVCSLGGMSPVACPWSSNEVHEDASNARCSKVNVNTPTSSQHHPILSGGILAFLIPGHHLNLGPIVAPIPNLHCWNCHMPKTDRHVHRRRPNIQTEMRITELGNFVKYGGCVQKSVASWHPSHGLPAATGTDSVQLGSLEKDLP